MNATLDTALKGIEGWLTDKEEMLLYRLAANVRAGSIVEIGSWKGKSTVCLAAGARAGMKPIVYAIDPHTGSPEHQEAFAHHVWTFDTFKENIRKAGVESAVQPIVKPAHEAMESVPGMVGLIFIDGAHEYEAVKQDFEDWNPKIPIGGVVAFHDTVGWSGPRKVVEEVLYSSREFADVRFVDSITYARKVRHNSAVGLAKNKGVLLVRDVSEWFRMRGIPSPLKKTAKRLIELVIH